MRNQTSPSKSGMPAASQVCGTSIIFHAPASSFGSAQPGDSARPGSFLRPHSAILRAKSASASFASIAGAFSPASAGRKSSRVERASPLVQASATVPPHEEWISPIGTSNSFWRSRPKK